MSPGSLGKQAVIRAENAGKDLPVSDQKIKIRIL